jgi:hypothetical protein
MPPDGDLCSSCQLLVHNFGRIKVDYTPLLSLLSFNHRSRTALVVKSKKGSIFILSSCLPQIIHHDDVPVVFYMVCPLFSRARELSSKEKTTVVL